MFNLSENVSSLFIIYYRDLSVWLYEKEVWVIGFVVYVVVICIEIFVDKDSEFWYICICYSGYYFCIVFCDIVVFVLFIDYKVCDVL